ASGVGAGCAPASSPRWPRRPGVPPPAQAPATPVPQPSCSRRRQPRRLVRDLDLALEDLAGRPLGQLVGEPDLARVLVLGQLALDVLLDVLHRYVLALLDHDCGADLLAQALVLDADHRGLGDGAVAV